MKTGSNTTYVVTVATPCEGGSHDGTGCEWHEMHHYDDEGRHWCPTGYMLCNAHGGVGRAEGSGRCQLWGEFPSGESS